MDATCLCRLSGRGGGSRASGGSIQRLRGNPGFEGGAVPPRQPYRTPAEVAPSGMLLPANRGSCASDGPPPRRSPMDSLGRVPKQDPGSSAARLHGERSSPSEPRLTDTGSGPAAKAASRGRISGPVGRRTMDGSPVLECSRLLPYWSAQATQRADAHFGPPSMRTIALAHQQARQRIEDRSAGRPWHTGRSGRRGKTPQSESLVRARGQLLFRTPPCWGRSQPATPCGKAIGEPKRNTFSEQSARATAYAINATVWILEALRGESPSYVGVISRSGTGRPPLAEPRPWELRCSSHAGSTASSASVSGTGS